MSSLGTVLGVPGEEHSEHRRGHVPRGQAPRLRSEGRGEGSSWRAGAGMAGAGPWFNGTHDGRHASSGGLVSHCAPGPSRADPRGCHCPATPVPFQSSSASIGCWGVCTPSFKHQQSHSLHFLCAFDVPWLETQGVTAFCGGLCPDERDPTEPAQGGGLWLVGWFWCCRQETFLRRCGGGENGSLRPRVEVAGAVGCAVCTAPGGLLPTRPPGQGAEVPRW